MLAHGNVTDDGIGVGGVHVEIDVGSDERTLVVASLFHAAVLGVVWLPTPLTVAEP